MNESKTYILRSDLQLRNCLRYLTEEVTMPDGKKQKRPYEVVIRPHIGGLTAEQRGGFHWLCKILGNELGYTEGEIKDMVKARVWGYDEKVGPDGKVYQFLRSSERNEDGRKKNKIEYAPLIEGVYQLGSEAGVVLPNLDPMRMAS